jgi:hypothetical protein
LSCAEATEVAEATEGADSWAGWAGVMASNYATQGRVATPEDPPISRHCERSEAIHAFLRRWMDCFVASLLAKMGWTAPDGISVPDW